MWNKLFKKEIKKRFGADILLSDTMEAWTGGCKKASTCMCARNTSRIRRQKDEEFS